MEISGIINNMLGNKRNREKYCAALLKAHWANIAGEAVAARSRPGGLENGILFLRVSGSSWAHHILTLKRQLLEKINNYPGMTALKEKIADLKITAAAEIESGPAPDEAEDGIILPELSEEEERLIKETAALTDDRTLAGAFARLLIKDKRRKKYYWNTVGCRCEKCGAVLAYKKKQCVVCDKERAREKQELLVRLLADTPWLEYTEAQQETNCSRQEFFSARQECRQKFLLRALAKNASNSDINRYVMIKTGCPIFLLTQALIDKTMEEARRSNHVPALGLRRYGAYS